MSHQRNVVAADATSVVEKFNEGNDGDDLTKPFDFADVTFLVENKPIYFNRGFLAMHSPHFKRLFYGADASHEKEIWLKDKKFDDILTLLKLLKLNPDYTEQLISDENIEQLLKLAEEYQLRQVTAVCESFLLLNWKFDKSKLVQALKLSARFGLCKALKVLLVKPGDDFPALLSDENVGQFLAIAKEYELPNIIDICEEYLFLNWKQSTDKVVRADEFSAKEGEQLSQCEFVSESDEEAPKFGRRDRASDDAGEGEQKPVGPPMPARDDSDDEGDTTEDSSSSKPATTKSDNLDAKLSSSEVSASQSEVNGADNGDESAVDIVDDEDTKHKKLGIAGHDISESLSGEAEAEAIEALAQLDLALMKEGQNEEATNGALDKSSPGEFSTPWQSDAVVTPNNGSNDLQSSSSAESLSTPPSSGTNKLSSDSHSPTVDETFNGDNTTKSSVEVESAQRLAEMILEQVSEGPLPQAGRKMSASGCKNETKSFVSDEGQSLNGSQLTTNGAATVSGLNVLLPVDEPTAAAIAYGLDKKDADEVKFEEVNGMNNVTGNCTDQLLPNQHRKVFVQRDGSSGLDDKFETKIPAEIEDSIPTDDDDDAESEASSDSQSTMVPAESYYSGSTGINADYDVHRSEADATSIVDEGMPVLHKTKRKANTTSEAGTVFVSNPMRDWEAPLKALEDAIKHIDGVLENHQAPISVAKAVISHAEKPPGELKSDCPPRSVESSVEPIRKQDGSSGQGRKTAATNGAVVASTESIDPLSKPPQIHASDIKPPAKKEKISDDERKILKEKVEETRTWLKANQSADSEEFKQKLKELSGVSKPILIKLYKDKCANENCFNRASHAAGKKGLCLGCAEDLLEPKLGPKLSRDDQAIYNQAPTAIICYASPGRATRQQQLAAEKKFLDDFKAKQLLSEFLAEIKTIDFDDSKAISCVLPHLMNQFVALIQSTVLQGQSLEKVLEFFQQLCASDCRPSYDNLLKWLCGPVYDQNTDLHKQAFHNIARCVAVLVSAKPECGNFTIQQFVRRLKSGKSDAIRLLALLSLGEIARRSPQFFESRRPDLVVLEAFSSPNEDVKTAASFALAGMAAANWKKYLPFVFSEIQSQPKRQYLLLHSLKEIICCAEKSGSHASTAEIIRQYINDIWSVLLEHSESLEEGTRNVVAECLGKLCLINPGTLLSKLKSCFEMPSPLARATVVTAVKFTIVDQPHAIDEQLRECIGDFLNTRTYGDLNVRRAALGIFNSAARYKPLLIRDLLPTLLPDLYRATKVRKELVREVEMGPFKHTIDDGLDLRKAAFECMQSLLEAKACLDQLEIFDFISHVEDGLKDHYDIKVLTYLMLARLAALCPTEVLQRLERLVEPIRQTCVSKVELNAAEQENEKQDELKRSAMRALLALQTITGSGKHLEGLLNLIQDTSHLNALYESVKKDPVSKAAEGDADMDTS